MCMCMCDVSVIVYNHRRTCSHTYIALCSASSPCRMCLCITDPGLVFLVCTVQRQKSKFSLVRVRIHVCVPCWICHLSYSRYTVPFSSDLFYSKSWCTCNLQSQYTISLYNSPLGFCSLNWYVLCRLSCGLVAIHVGVNATLHQYHKLETYVGPLMHIPERCNMYF